MPKTHEVHLRHLDKEVYKDARRQQIAEGYRTVGEFLQHVLAEYQKEVSEFEKATAEYLEAANELRKEVIRKRVKGR